MTDPQPLTFLGAFSSNESLCTIMKKDLQHISGENNKPREFIPVQTFSLFSFIKGLLGFVSFFLFFPVTVCSSVLFL